ncbi:hypothetical protein M885DRAFT_468938, partial [Pelagophyceae sp. CCMP2097]
MAPRKRPLEKGPSKKAPRKGDSKRIPRKSPSKRPLEKAPRKGPLKRRLEKRVVARSLVAALFASPQTRRRPLVHRPLVSKQGRWFPNVARLQTRAFFGGFLKVVQGRTAFGTARLLQKRHCDEAAAKGAPFEACAAPWPVSTKRCGGLAAVSAATGGLGGGNARGATLCDSKTKTFPRALSSVSKALSNVSKALSNVSKALSTAPLEAQPHRGPVCGWPALSTLAARFSHPSFQRPSTS